jgi:hypothetical protein
MGISAWVCSADARRGIKRRIWVSTARGVSVPCRYFISGARARHYGPLQTIGTPKLLGAQSILLLPFYLQRAAPTRPELGFGRIVALEREAPNTFVNPV